MTKDIKINTNARNDQALKVIKEEIIIVKESKAPTKKKGAKQPLMNQENKAQVLRGFKTLVKSLNKAIATVSQNRICPVTFGSIKSLRMQLKSLQSKVDNITAKAENSVIAKTDTSSNEDETV